MKTLVSATALILLLASTAYAEPPCTRIPQTSEDGSLNPCSKERQPKARRGITPADKENLDRAMRRNMLHSIDDQLRRQRAGN